MSYDEAKGSNIKLEEEEVLLVPEKYPELPFDELRRQLKGHGVIDVFWTQNDIKDTAHGITIDGENVVLTDEQVDWISEQLVRKHDANIGINWDTIEHWIFEALEPKS